MTQEEKDGAIPVNAHEVGTKTKPKKREITINVKRMAIYAAATVAVAGVVGFLRSGSSSNSTQESEETE